VKRSNESQVLTAQAGQQPPIRALARAGSFAAALFAAAPVCAQEATEAQDAAESRATAFQAVEGSQKEDVPGGPLMVAAYAVVLVLLVGYVARLGALQRRIAGELERLTRALARGKPE
jgi:CcmD family protein